MDTINLTNLIAAWDELHVKDTGDMGFCDLEKALANAGVLIVNNITARAPVNVKETAWTGYSIALEKAPPCEKCVAPMTRYDAIKWVCPNDDCDQNTKPKSVPGIFPVEIVRR